MFLITYVYTYSYVSNNILITSDTECVWLYRYVISSRKSHPHRRTLYITSKSECTLCFCCNEVKRNLNNTEQNTHYTNYKKLYILEYTVPLLNDPANFVLNIEGNFKKLIESFENISLYHVLSKSLACLLNVIFLLKIWTSIGWIFCSLIKICTFTFFQKLRFLTMTNIYSRRWDTIWRKYKISFKSTDFFNLTYFYFFNFFFKF